MKRSLATALVLLAFALISFPQDRPLPPALESLVQAERTFARTSVEQGVRSSFTEFFADDGLNFRPQPVNVKEDYRNRPAPPGPQPFVLNWEPIFADISAAGDLGYTTGPVVITDATPEKKPTRYSYYFSVWKKQLDGSWKVRLDFGTGTPEAVDPTKGVSFQAAPRSGWKGGSAKANLEAERQGLLQLEAELSNTSKKSGVAEAYRQYAMDYSRLHRDDLMPVVGKQAMLAFLAEKGTKEYSFETLDGEVAKSADLGYTYGKYESADKTSAAAVEKGYFIRVWKRDANGKWKIVADIAKPLPSPSK